LRRLTSEEVSTAVDKLNLPEFKYGTLEDVTHAWKIPDANHPYTINNIPIISIQDREKEAVRQEKLAEMRAKRNLTNVRKIDRKKKNTAKEDELLNDTSDEEVGGSESRGRKKVKEDKLPGMCYIYILQCCGS
jgi:hypothetical protein